MRISRRMAIAASNRNRKRPTLTYNTALAALDLTDFSNLVNLENSTDYLSAATAGNSYAIYMVHYGGASAQTITHVDETAYSSTLTKVTCPKIGKDRGKIKAGSVGEYAIFAGGQTRAKAGYQQSYVDAYNSSLTRTTPTALSESRIAATPINFDGKLFFLGGYFNNNGYDYNDVDIYDSSLTRSIMTLSEKRGGMAAAENGKYIVYAGGDRGGGNDARHEVRAINKSLTESNLESLPVRTSFWDGGASGRAGDFAVIQSNSVMDDVNHIYGYDTSLVRHEAEPLNTESDYPASVTKDGALICIGYGAVFDGYDSSLTRYIAGEMFDGYKASSLNACVLGENALISSPYSTPNVQAYSFK